MASTISARIRKGINKSQKRGAIIRTSIASGQQRSSRIDQRIKVINIFILEVILSYNFSLLPKEGVEPSPGVNRTGF